MPTRARTCGCECLFHELSPRDDAIYDSKLLRLLLRATASQLESVKTIIRFIAFSMHN
jgi:hypothetical protein